MKEFLDAALPWILMGLALCFAYYSKKGEK